jgi:hypothetical protein
LATGEKKNDPAAPADGEPGIEAIFNPHRLSTIYVS